jgi:hypothetical protein
MCSKHFLPNLVEVSSASQVAPFLVDLLSSLGKNTSHSVGCCNIPPAPNIALLQSQMVPLTIPHDPNSAK